MTRPASIDAAHLLEFIGNSGVVVILVSVHTRHAFNPALAAQLSAEHKDIRLGVVSIYDLIAAGGGARRFLIAGLRAHGAPGPRAVLPGYYLFASGQMLAWDAGLPGKADGEVIAGSLLLGTIWSGVTRDLSFVAQALHLAADETGASRVAARFREVLAGRASGGAGAGRAWTDQSHSATDLSRAYQTLGIRPTASDREVHHAWRQRRIQHHPDRARNRVDFERRSRISAEINHARDVVVSHRARAC